MGRRSRLPPAPRPAAQWTPYTRRASRGSETTATVGVARFAARRAAVFSDASSPSSICHCNRRRANGVKPHSPNTFNT